MIYPWSTHQLWAMFDVMIVILLASVYFVEVDTLRTAKIKLEHEMSNIRSELEKALETLLRTSGATKRGRIPSKLRQHIMDRCKYTCQFCARPGQISLDPDGALWHIEHVIPASKGGPTHADNLTLACSSCNLRKGTMPAYAFIQKLVREGGRKS